MHSVKPNAHQDESTYLVDIFLLFEIKLLVRNHKDHETRPNMPNVYLHSHVTNIYFDIREGFPLEGFELPHLGIIPL